MLGDLEAVDDPAGPLADQAGRLVVQAPARVVDRRLHLRQLLLGGGEQRLALAGALVGDLRVAADDQPLARIGVGGDLGQIRLVEQRQLQLAALDQRPHLRRPQRRDPVEAVLLERGDVGLGDHAAVAADDDPLDPEAPLDPLQRRRERLVVVQRSVEDLDRDRPALRRAGQPVADLQLSLPAVARVAERRQRTLAALEVAGGEVVEDEAALAQVAAGERRLDPRLAGEQPVHRREQLRLARVRNREFRAERRQRELARRGQLRAGPQQPLTDHRQAEIALPARPAREHPLQPEPARRAQHRGDMPVRQRALDPQRLLGGHERLTGKSPLDQLDHVPRQVREVAERLVLDLAALAVAAPQQRRLVHLPLVVATRRRHVHRTRSPWHTRIMPAAPDEQPTC